MRAECKKHSKMHVAQCEEFNDLKKQSKSNLLEGAPIWLRTMLLVMDRDNSLQLLTLAAISLVTLLHVAVESLFFRRCLSGRDFYEHIHMGGRGGKQLDDNSVS